MLIKTRTDRSQVGNRDINGVGEIVGKITTSGSLVVNIYDFLSKLKSSSCLR